MHVSTHVLVIVISVWLSLVPMGYILRPVHVVTVLKFGRMDLPVILGLIVLLGLLQQLIVSISWLVTRVRSVTLEVLIYIVVVV